MASQDIPALDHPAESCASSVSILIISEVFDTMFELFVVIPEVLEAMFELFVAIPEVFEVMFELFIAIPEVLEEMFELFVVIPEVFEAMFELFVVIFEVFEEMFESFVEIFPSTMFIASINAVKFSFILEALIIVPSVKVFGIVAAYIISVEKVLVTITPIIIFE